MNKPTKEQLDSLKKIHQLALIELNQGIYTHFLQILNDIDRLSDFSTNLSSANISKNKSDMISIMESSIKYYENL